MTFVDFMITL